jgi:RNA polymerase sigma factor (sigma-70 family)
MVENGGIDVSVIERFSNGDKTAFGIIYNHFFKAIKANISRIVLHKDVAEDILQDVFFKLWQNRQKFKDTEGLAAWLFRVSYNSSLTYLKSMLRNRKFIFSELPVIMNDRPVNEESVGIWHIKETHLHDAINHLPQRKRQVIDLCKFQGKTYAEAGSILGIEKNTVKEYMVASLKFIKWYIISKDAR